MEVAGGLEGELAAAAVGGDGHERHVVVRSDGAGVAHGQGMVLRRRGGRPPEVEHRPPAAVAELQAVAEREHVVEGGPADLVHDERPAELGFLGEDASADLGVAHAADALGEREVGEVVAVGGAVLGRVELRLVAHEHAEAPVPHLGSEVGAALVGAAGGVEPGPPVADLRPFHHQERDGLAAGLPLADQPLELPLHGVARVAGDLAPDAGGHHLQHAGADLVHGGEHRSQLVLGGEGARDWVPPDVAVAGGAAAGEAECTRPEAGAHDGAHLRQLVVGGVVEGPLAHDVGAHGGAAALPPAGPVRPVLAGRPAR